MLELVTFVDPDNDEPGVEVTELAVELELESSLARSPDAHATPTSSRAAATAVATPNIFLIITNLLVVSCHQCPRCRFMTASAAYQEEIKTSGQVPTSKQGTRKGVIEPGARAGSVWWLFVRVSG
jgi:hypothetical protein